MKKLSVIFVTFVIVALLNSCKEQETKQDVSAPKVRVKISKIEYGYLPDYIELSGKTIYLNKSNLIAPISGYITQVNAQQGDIVKKGQVLFEMKTSEAYLMQNTDSLTNIYYGTIKVRATVNGRIMSLSVMNKNVFVDRVL